MKSSTRYPRTRRGFTLAEIMVAMVVFGVVMSAAFGFLLAQSKGFRKLATKSAQIQNGRFGRDIMRQELRTEFRPRRSGLWGAWDVFQERRRPVGKGRIAPGHASTIALLTASLGGNRRRKLPSGQDAVFDGDHPVG